MSICTTAVYVHVDVFSTRPYSGNSLAVFPSAPGLTTDQMLRITQELRHFEAVFLETTEDPSRIRARVFDLFEELPFAGHPLLGAGAVLHQLADDPRPHSWEIKLATKAVTVTTQRSEGGYYAVLDQGTPQIFAPIAREEVFAEAFSLTGADLHPELPPQIVSTGLAYLILPVARGVLGRARVRRDITPLLSRIGAQFAVLLDEESLEIRHWNNDGLLEDVATGSAAGTVGAYRLSHRRARGGETFVLHQGRYAGRPSVLRVQPEGTPEAVRTVKVGGDVAIVGRGALEVLP